MRSNSNIHSITLIRMLESIRNNATRNVFSETELVTYYKTLVYLIEQLDFPYWSDRFKAKELDRYFFQTMQISFIGNKEIILARIYFLWSRYEPLNASLKMRGLEVLIRETVGSLSTDQIRELCVHLESIVANDF